VRKRDFKLDSFQWLREESLEDADALPEPEELATDAIAELEAAVGERHLAFQLQRAIRPDDPLEYHRVRAHLPTLL
jgi:hypothetical protein